MTIIEQLLYGFFFRVMFSVLFFVEEFSWTVVQSKKKPALYDTIWVRYAEKRFLGLILQTTGKDLFRCVRYLVFKVMSI
jgi:hypothetical protein